MSSKEQHLVNAQVSVNRAVFAMNMRNQNNPNGARCDDEYIIECINSALADLCFSKDQYSKQPDLFPEEEAT